MMKGIVYGTFATLAVMVCISAAAPEPAIVPGPDDWTVEVGFEHPQQIVVQLSGQDRPRRFWYLLVTLTNKTNRDVDFYPKCELMTDTLQVIPAGKNTPIFCDDNFKVLLQ